MRFTLFKDVDGLYRWHLRAANNRNIAASGEAYYNKSDCLAAINLVKGYAPGAPLDDDTLGFGR